MILRLAAVSLCLAAVGCASHSGYNVDVRNITNTPIVLDLKAAKGKDEPKVVRTFHVPAGGTTSDFTEIEAKSKVTLEAQVEGETARPPATMPLTLGQSRVDVIPPRDKDANDPKTPRIRLREREGH